jgi:ATP-binding cassette subfamily C protein
LDEPERERQRPACGDEDVEGEHAIFERLLRVTPRPTIVMIAHRLESLRHCQRVLLFEEGRLNSSRSLAARRPIVV